ncbi:Polysaccharide pyruvyl transferase family protein WcaK [Flavobacterium terrae]|uniref:Polysaccharide pyruvyl transferase family protein WcaK n=1 Tax=Flavobacterium terrae TaxID=415425 RepID=A0A1M6FRT4_9FLAO|nr:Polysaccharide pyruvyl transferase family protein WcaK [Flavobacterium terrae]
MDKFKYFLKYLKYVFSRKKRAIYIGCLGNNNLGDDAVYTGIVNMVKSKLVLYDINYAKVSSGSFFRKIYFPEPDYIILGGGTIIRKGKNESYLRLLNLFLDKYPNAKLLSLGAGVANTEFAQKIGFPTDIPAWIEFLNKCFFISIRGPLSKNILKNEWKINQEVEILYDPAIFHNQTKEIKAKNKTIGINFCDIIGRIHGFNQEAVGVFAKSLTQKLLDEEWIIWLYPTTPNDINYMIKILGEDIVSKVNIYKNCLDLNKSIDFFNSIDLFVGMRLHAIVFSSLSSTPFFAIEYEQKTSDFLKSIDLEEYVIRTDSLDVDEVLKKIHDIYQNVDILQDSIYQKMLFAKKEQVTRVKELLSRL